MVPVSLLLLRSTSLFSHLAAAHRLDKGVGARDMVTLSSHPPFSVVVLDFDDTVTLRDTTPLLPRIAAHARPQDARVIEDCWADLTARFLRDHVEVMAKLSSSSTAATAIPPPSSSFSSSCTNSDQFRRLESFLDLLHEVDAESIERVSKSRVLAGITRDVIRAALTGPLKAEWGASPGASCVLQWAAAARDVQCHIVSINFSRDVVGTILGELMGQEWRAQLASLKLVTNDLEFDELGRTTGNVLVHVGGAMGKREHFLHIASQVEGLSVYVGDSATDLLAMLSADCGIVIGNRSSFDKVAESFGIEVLPLKAWEGSTRPRKEEAGRYGDTVFRAASWDELDAFLRNGATLSSTE